MTTKPDCSKCRFAALCLVVPREEAGRVVSSRRKVWGHHRLHENLIQCQRCQRWWAADLNRGGLRHVHLMSMEATDKTTQGLCPCPICVPPGESGSTFHLVSLETGELEGTVSVL